MITPIFWIIPVASILALVIAWFFFKQMMKESEETKLMTKINRHIHKKAKKTTIPPIFGTHPVCEERLFGLSTKFFSMAILNTGTRIFQPINKANTIDSTNLQLSANKLSISLFYN